MFATIVAAAAIPAVLAAQQAQQNVNVLPVVLPVPDPITGQPTSSSIDTAAWTGDLYLQRQVEPTVAVSTRNPEHVLAFFNDYRAVDISSDIGMGEQSPLSFTATAWRFMKGLFARVTGRAPAPRRGKLPDTAAASEAWVGGARSYDGAHTFTGMFVPGAPFDTSPQGTASPLKGFQAATDPVLAAAPCGKFYLALLGFTRNGASRMVVAEYQDSNDVEGGDTIDYVGMKVLEDANNAQWGYFLDKPAIAVDVKRTANAGCGHNVYVSYTTFNGLTKDGKTQSKLTVARSLDDGATFTTTKINQPYQQGQGTALAVDPANGTVYVAFRHFNSPNTILVHKSTNSGQTWAGQPVDLLAGNAAAPQLQKFDQPTVSTAQNDQAALAFRSLSFPTIAAGNGAVFVAFTERVDTNPQSPTFSQPMAGGSPRIMLMRSTNGGSTWVSVPDGTVARKAIDIGERDAPCAGGSCTPTPIGFGYLPQYRSSGPQVMPQLTFAGGRLMLVYYESRGWAYTSPESIDKNVGILPSSGGYISGLQRLMDVRAALLDASSGALLGSSQVSRYPLKPWLKRGPGGELLPETLGDVIAVNRPCSPDDGSGKRPCVRAVSRVGSPTSASGTSPFIGDYIGVAGAQFVAKPDQSGWKWVVTPDEAPSRLFHGIFTDNRNLIPPDDPNNLASWQAYSPPWYSTSCVNAGSRNSDVLTSRIDADLVVTAPTSYKQLTLIQRAFPVVVSNGTSINRYFRLSFGSGGGIASFAQQYRDSTGTVVDAPVDHLDVLIFPFSSVTRVVYVTTGSEPVRVDVNEIAGPLDPVTGQGGNLVTPGLSGTITLNADSTNPWLTLTNTEMHAPSIGAPSIGAPSIGAPSIGAPSIGAPSIGAPSIGAPSIGAPSIGASTIGGDTVYGYVDTTWTVANAGNTASGYLSYAHLDHPEQYESCNKFQLMVLKSSTNGTVAGCQSSNVSQDEILANVPLSTADLANPSIGAPSIGAPSIGAPSIGAPSIGAVSFASAPPVEGSTSGDGTLKAPRPKDIVSVVLRAYFTQDPGNPDTACALFDPLFDTPSLAVKAMSKDVIDGVLQDTISVSTRGADLVVEPIDAAESTVQAGTEVTFPAGGWTLTNVGNTDAVSVDGTIESSVYISARDGDRPVTLIATSWTTSGQIEAGASVPYQGAQITIPASTVPGTYRLFVLADDGSQSVDGQVSELDETNNVSNGIVIVVTSANAAPVAVDDVYTTDEDTVLNVSGPGLLTNDTDADGNVLTALVVSQPSHGTLTLNADGSLIYTPAPDYNGTDSFTYKANDGIADSAVAEVTLTITAINDAPIAGADSYAATEDTILTVVAPGVLGDDTDVDGGPLAAGVATPPAHGSLALASDGSFTYTPSANFNGGDTFTYTVSDGYGGSATGTVTLSVAAVNDAPVAGNDSYGATEDTPLVVSAPGVLGTDSDPDGDSLVAAVASGPAHGVLSLSADGSFTYTPSANFNGGDTFTYTISDGHGGSATGIVTLAVAAVNDAPAAVADSYTTDEDTPLNVAAKGVLFNDTDVDGDTLTAVLVAGTGHGTLSLNADGSFTYTPAANYNGPDSFTYKANDGRADSPAATVSLTINAVNDAPVAAGDGYTTDEDTLLSVSARGVLANDSDVDGNTLTAVLVAAPSHGTLNFGANGSFTYAPVVNYNGVDSFTYKANDGTADSAVALVTLTITAVNDAPVALTDSYQVNENEKITVAMSLGVLANDADPELNPLTAAVFSGPGHGTVTMNLDGSFTYTPSANYAGTDTFTYRANDGLLNSNVATVTITVDPGGPDYGFNGLLLPWTESPIYTANLGNSVPLSWQYLKNGRPSDTSSAMPELRFTKMSGTADDLCGGTELMLGSNGGPLVDRDSPGSTSFKYINTKQQPHTWQFNWKTSDPVFSSGCWLARVYLPSTLQLNRAEGFKIILK